MTENQELLVEQVDGVAWLTMNRPEVLNARNRSLRSKLAEAFKKADADTSTRVIVLTGSGDRSFSVGMDLKESAADQTRSRWDSAEVDLADADALWRVRKPTIAALNGYTLGGGLELALCCDIRVAADQAQLAFPEASRGTMPGSGGTQRLPRIVGYAVAMDLMLSGRRLSAEEAFRVGLVNHVVPQAELYSYTRSVAESIAANAPLSVRYIKEAVRRGQDLPLSSGLEIEQDLSAIVADSEDAREGSRAFVEKRPPEWRER